MSLTRHVFTTSGMLLAANASVRVLGVVSMPLLTHWLPPAAFGQAALASALISLISVVWLMGMDMSYSRSFLSRTAPNGAPAETFCWRMACMMALGAGISAALLWLVHAAEDRSALRSMAVLVFAGAAGSVILAMAQTRSRLYNQHVRLALAVGVGGVCATCITLALAWRPLADERALVTGYVAAYLLPILIVGVPGLRQLREPSGLDAAARKQIFLVGFPGIVTAPVYWVISSSDRWFLQVFTESSVVGIYSVASTFGLLGMMVNSALLAIWLPEATRAHEAGVANGDQQLAKMMVRLMALMAIVCVGVSVFGPDLLRWLTAPRFQSAVGIVPVLAAGVFGYGCYQLARTGLYLDRSLGLDARIMGIFAIVSLFSNFVLVPRFGTSAAAGVQCLSFAGIALTAFFVAQRRRPLPLPVARILAGILILIVAIVVAVWLEPITGIRTALVKGAFVLGVAALLAFTLDAEVPSLIRHVLAEMDARFGGKGQ